MTVQAQYEINQYTVRFLDENDNVLDTQVVTYLEAATAPAYSKIGYTYAWDKAFDSITSDLDVKVVDTLFLSRNLIDKNYIENYKLGTLCKYFCLDYFNYHNATEDVLATSYVFLNLLNFLHF